MPVCGDQPGTIDLAGTESLGVKLGDEAKSRSLAQKTHRLESRMLAGQRPAVPVGRAGFEDSLKRFSVTAVYD